MIINRNVNFNNINEIRFFNHFFFNILRVNINFFLFKMFFEEFISKLFSFNSFLIIDLRDCVIIINKVIDKKEKFFDVNILLLLCLLIII